LATVQRMHGGTCFFIYGQLFFYLHSIEFYLYYPYLTVTEIIVGDSNYKKSLLIRWEGSFYC